MRLHDGLGTLPQRSVWRLFPWFAAAAMAVVWAVNGIMVYSALHTFPGNAGDDGFDLSNHYNIVLDHMDHQAALGWAVTIGADQAGHPSFVLMERSGAPLTGAAVEASAERPVGEALARPVRFAETAPGQYVAADVLTPKGQWDLRLSIKAHGETFVTTRRIVVR